MPIRLALASLLLASLLPAGGPALAFTDADTRTPLRAAVAPGRWVALGGRIVPGSPAVVRAALDRAGPGRVAVLIDSPGGSIAPALAIGRMIRARGLPVAVARTARGGVADGGAGCASACVLVLAAGVARSVGPGAGVGVHRLVAWSTYSRTWDVYRVFRRRGVVVRRELLSRRLLSSRDTFAEAPPSAYAAVGRYLAEMGEAPALLALMRATPATRLHWMTPGEMRETRIATDRNGPGPRGRG